MSYATLMVHVDANLTCEQTIRVACQIADKFSSRLIGVSATPIPAPIITNGVIMQVATNEEIDQLRERLEHKEIWFRDEADARSRVLEWRSELDFPTDFMIAQAHCADLLIVNASRGFQGSYNSLDAAGVILKAGRPVLVLPAEIRSLRADRIVVGWKDAREARRAIVDALPFMHEATRVTVAEICEQGDERAAQRSLEDLVRYLDRHRIKSRSKVLVPAEGSNAERLLQLARDEGADLLVTGAYGHSRLGEWVFGGVTQDLLASAPIACLMSH